MWYMTGILPFLGQQLHLLYLNNYNINTNTRYVGIPHEHLYDREPGHTKRAFRKDLLRLLS